MSSMVTGIAEKAGRRLFEQHLDQYKPADPLYEYYVDNKGKQKRRKRELPPGLSKRDAAILKSVKRRAHYLDKGFKLCGFQFGWTFIIGIIPGMGDIADATLNYVLVLKKCQQADLPSWLMREMLMNNLISVGAGLIPFLGDIVLAQWKANWRNAALLEEFLRVRGEEYLKGTSPDSKQGAIVKPGAGRTAEELVPAPNKKKDAVPEHKVPEAERAAIIEQESAAASGSGRVPEAGPGTDVQRNASSSSWWKGRGASLRKSTNKGKGVDTGAGAAAPSGKKGSKFIEGGVPKSTQPETAVGPAPAQ